MTRAERLAKALLRDRAEHAPRGAIIAECFLCGHSFWPGRQRFDEDDNGRFCSAKCRDRYDFDGARSIASDPAPHTVTRWRVVVGGDPGYLVNTPMAQSGDGYRVACRGCGKLFVSRGWAYCAQTCRRESAERHESAALMAEVGMDGPAKRLCSAPGCTNTIPKWRKGRAVSKATRFCSAKCAARARKAQTCTDAFEGVLAPETVKKCPENGPSGATA
jgi:hypothetical protein